MKSATLMIVAPDGTRKRINIKKLIMAQNITEVRKVIKTLQAAHDENQMQKLIDWIRDFVEDFNEEQKERLNRLDAYLVKVRFAQKTLNHDVSLRGRQKRWVGFSQEDPRYTALNEQVRADREELKRLKAAAKKIETEFNEAQRLRLFINRCLELGIG